MTTLIIKIKANNIEKDFILEDQSEDLFIEQVKDYFGKSYEDAKVVKIEHELYASSISELVVLEKPQVLVDFLKKHRILSSELIFDQVEQYLFEHSFDGLEAYLNEHEQLALEHICTLDLRLKDAYMKVLKIARQIDYCRWYYDKQLDTMTELSPLELIKSEEHTLESCFETASRNLSLALEKISRTINCPVEKIKQITKENK